MSVSALVGLLALVVLLAFALYREGPISLAVAVALLVVPCLVNWFGYSSMPALEGLGVELLDSVLRFASVIATTIAIACLAPRCSPLGGLIAGMMAAFSRVIRGSSMFGGSHLPVASPESGALVLTGVLLGTALVALDRLRIARARAAQTNPGPRVMIATKRDP